MAIAAVALVQAAFCCTTPQPAHVPPPARQNPHPPCLAPPVLWGGRSSRACLGRWGSRSVGRGHAQRACGNLRPARTGLSRRCTPSNAGLVALCCNVVPAPAPAASPAAGCCQVSAWRGVSHQRAAAAPPVAPLVAALRCRSGRAQLLPRQVARNVRHADATRASLAHFFGMHARSTMQSGDAHN